MQGNGEEVEEGGGGEEEEGGEGVARHGDWPWHVALMKEGVHVCDGTLIHQQWVMSTKSCFQVPP